MLHNPSLREEPLDQAAAVIPHKQETSILDWLESTGRLQARDDGSTKENYLEEGEEIEGLMAVDEVGYDDDDDFVEIGDLDEEV